MFYSTLHSGCTISPLPCLSHSTLKGSVYSLFRSRKLSLTFKMNGQRTLKNIFPSYDNFAPYNQHTRNSASITILNDTAKLWSVCTIQVSANPCYSNLRADHSLLAGDEHFEEAIRFVEHHRLYTDALRIWSDDSSKHIVGFRK